MPRYFFNIRNGWDVVPDEEGMDFPNLNQAELEGCASARDLAVAFLYGDRTLAADAVELADEDGNVLVQIKVEPKCLLA